MGLAGTKIDTDELLSPKEIEELDADLAAMDNNIEADSGLQSLIDDENECD